MATREPPVSAAKAIAAMNHAFVEGTTQLLAADPSMCPAPSG
jgi:hypothetical protein